MRCGFYSLAGLVTNELGQDPLSGDVFIFIGKRSNQISFFSSLGSCQRNNVQPHQWLSDVLAKLNDSGYEGKFSDLLPNRWQSS